MPAKLVVLCYNFYAFFFLKSEVCYLHSNCKSSLIFNEKKKIKLLMYLPDVITYKVLISKGGYINQKLVI